MQHFPGCVLFIRLTALLWASVFTSCTTAVKPGGDYLIVSGGPALREWENLRRPGEQHDRYAGNFIKAAHIRMEQLRQQSGEDVRLTWLVYRPAYVTREKEERQTGAASACPLSEIEARAAACRARLVWFSERDELIDILNRHAPGSIAGFEYFGHSNLYAFMFDYSNYVCGASICYLHVCDLGQLKRGLFGRNAHVQSWGCSTADRREGPWYMSAVWKRCTGHAMIGAVGKTDYTPISDNRSLPAADPALGWGQ